MSGLLKVTSQYFVFRLVNGAFGLLTISVFTHLLSPEHYGQYALLAAGIGLVSVVAYHWLAVSLARFIAERRDELVSLLSVAKTLFWITTGCCLLAALLILPVWGMTIEHAATVAVVVIGAAAMGRFNIAVQIANALQLSTAYGLMTSVRVAIVLVVGLLLIHVGLGYFGAALALMLAPCVAVFVGEKRLLARPLSDTSIATVSRQELLRYGLPLSLTYIAATVIDLSDRFLLNWMLGPSAVAGYAASYDFAQQTIGALLNVVLLATFPGIVAAKATSEHAALVQMLISGRALVGLAGVLVLGLSALSQEIAAYLLGPAVQGYADSVIPVVSLAIAVGCIKSYFLDVWFQVRKQTKNQLATTVLMAVANVLLNIALIPLWGVPGAAVAALAAFLIGAIASWHFGLRGQSLPDFGVDVLKVIVVVSIALFGVKLFSGYQGVIYFFAKSFALILVYVGLLYLLNYGNLRKSGAITRLLG